MKHSVLIVKALIGAFNKEKALVGDNSTVKLCDGLLTALPRDVRGHGVQPGAEAVGGQGGHPQQPRQEPRQPRQRGVRARGAQPAQVTGLAPHRPHRS